MISLGTRFLENAILVTHLLFVKTDVFILLFAVNFNVYNKYFCVAIKYSSDFVAIQCLCSGGQRRERRK